MVEHWIGIVGFVASAEYLRRWVVGEVARSVNEPGGQRSYGAVLADLELPADLHRMVAARVTPGA